MTSRYNPLGGANRLRTNRPVNQWFSWKKTRNIFIFFFPNNSFFVYQTTNFCPRHRRSQLVNNTIYDLKKLKEYLILQHEYDYDISLLLFTTIRFFGKLMKPFSSTYVLVKLIIFWLYNNTLLLLTLLYYTFYRVANFQVEMFSLKTIRWFFSDEIELHYYS